MYFRVFTFMILVLGLQAGLSADTVFLKDGSSVNGVITGQTKSEIIIRSSDTVTRRIAKNSIRRIIYGNTAPDTGKALSPNQSLPEGELSLYIRDKEAHYAALDVLRKSLTEEEKKLRTEEKADRTSEFRMKSALLPGWGQFAGGAWLRGAVYSGAIISGAAASAAVYNESVSRSRYVKANRNSILIRDYILFPAVMKEGSAAEKTALLCLDYKSKADQKKSLRAYESGRNTYYAAAGSAALVYLLQIIDVPASNPAMASFLYLPESGGRGWTAVASLTARF